MKTTATKKIAYGFKWLLFWIEAGFILAITHPSKLKREWRDTKFRHDELKRNNPWLNHKN